MPRQKTDEQLFLNALGGKVEYANYFVFQLNKYRDEARKQNGEINSTFLVSAYGEAFLFELSAWFDILIKYLCAAKFDARLYFTEESLKRLSPQDEFISKLRKLYTEGVDNDPEVSIKRLMDYRNAAAHAHALYAGGFGWNSKIRIPFSHSEYLLPDDPSVHPNEWKKAKLIGLFRLVDAATKITNTIAEDIIRNKPYGKYSIVKGEGRNSSGTIDEIQQARQG